MECKKTDNLKSCSCSYSCGRRGLCCDCVSYHRKARQIPACFFSKDAEKTYNRSYEYFAALVSDGKI